LSQLNATIGSSIRETMDRKLFWVMLGISTFIAILISTIGAGDDGIWLAGMFKMDFLAKSASDPVWKNIATVFVVDLILGHYLGGLCVLFALIATVSSFTADLESGRLDVVLSKPLSRTKIYLFRFISGTVFMVLQSVFFVAITFVIIGIRWRLWLWEYFWAIPLFVLLFSYLFSIACLLGTLVRSAPSAILLTAISWIVIVLAQAGHAMVLVGDILGDSPWASAVTGTYWALPKLSDITSITRDLIQPGSDLAGVEKIRQLLQFFGGPATLTSDQVVELRINPFLSIGSSLGFVAAMLGLGVYRFSRQDY
jgi:ABC-type transport system involved in multi-copper enzyme maturation permease subunit